MVNYESARAVYGKEVSQTLDEPVMVGDLWELSDVLAALGCAIVFGVILYSWTLLLMSVTWFLVISPKIKKSHPRGYLFHWPYRFLKVRLPGLVNPGNNKKYSD